MNEYIKYTLITVDQFQNRFKPIADKWNKDGSVIRMSITLNRIKLDWVLTNTMIEMMGETHFFKEYDFHNYTHKMKGYPFGWHEKWFAEKDFITFEEFSILDPPPT